MQGCLFRDTVFPFSDETSDELPEPFCPIDPVMEWVLLWPQELSPQCCTLFVMTFDENHKQVLLCIDEICPYTEIEISKFYRDSSQVVAFLESDTVMLEIVENWSLVGLRLETATVICTLDRLTSYLTQTINH